MAWPGQWALRLVWCFWGRRSYSLSLYSGQILWSCVHECFGQSWNPQSMVQAHALLRVARGQVHRIAWRVFSALSWARWTKLSKMALKECFLLTLLTTFLNGVYFFSNGLLWGGRRTVTRLRMSCSRSNNFLLTIGEIWRHRFGIPTDSRLLLM